MLLWRMPLVSIVVTIVGHLLWLTTMASTGIAEIVKNKYWLHFMASFLWGSAFERKLFTIIHIYFYVYMSLPIVSGIWIMG